MRCGSAESIRARRLRSAKQAGYKPAALSVGYHTEETLHIGRRPYKSYKQQFTWTTSQLADDKIEAPRVDLRNRNTMIVGFLLTLNARNSLGKI